MTNEKITLSYSTLELFHSCERKFQHRKVLRTDVEREESPALSNGRAVDEGYGEYLRSRNEDMAVFKTWLNYWPVLEDNIRSEIRAVHAVESLITRTPVNWEIAKLPNGRDATQVAFRIDCGEDFDYIGFIDAIVWDKDSKEFFAVEVKTTSMQSNIRTLYENSPQALAYAVLLEEMLHGEMPDMLRYYYMVAQMPRAKGKLPVALEPMEMVKPLRDVLQWLITLRLDINHINECLDIGFFPKRNSCYSFGKECPFFGVCDITAKEDALVRKEDNARYADIKFDFEFKLDDMIQKLYRKLGLGVK